jgi:hypothetical protein
MLQLVNLPLESLRMLNKQDPSPPPSLQPAPSVSTPPTVQPGAVSYTTWGFDNARTGVNPYETQITTTNVANLALAGQFKVDGDVYAQPLLLHSSHLAQQGLVSIPAGFCPKGVVSSGYQGSNATAPPNLLVVATMKNWYFFDADAADPDSAVPIYCYQLGSESSRVPLTEQDIL